MPQRRLLVGRVLVVAWREPEHDDLVSVVEELRGLEVRLKRPPLYLSLIGPNALPQGIVRHELAGFYRDLVACCESIHVVIEGGDFEISIKRSVIANVMLTVPGRGRIFVENSLDRIRANSPPAVRADLDVATRVAGEQKHFDFARSRPPAPG